MKKKFGLISVLACVGVACIAAGCASGDELEQYQNEGYKISVTYDANGGSFLSRPGVTLMDLFNPSNYTPDENGVVHVKLTEPTDPDRQAAGSAVTLTLSGHFFAGWYQTREVSKNEAGEIVDTAGKVLEEKDGSYYYVGTETVGTPAYTYDGYWDFENDTIDYAEDDGLFEMTLYAAWVPNYRFEYYYQDPEDEQEWTLLETTTFDYKATNAEGSATYDWDTIWLPDWQNGGMNHTYRYANSQFYKFPKIDGTTFSKAYTDPECTQEITEKTFTHTGTLDLEHGVAINPVQKIYIVTVEGEYYRIEKAEDLSGNGNPEGIYEIRGDLDFKNGEVRWPAVFGTSVFKGKMYGADGQTYKISNVKATHSSGAATTGGLFARIAAGASIENLTFENATFEISNAPAKKDEAYFGLFAGYVEDGATVTNVTVGGSIRLGAISNWSDKYDFNLCANGNVAGITRTAVKVYVYGVYLYAEEAYEYAVDIGNVSVADDYLSIGLALNMEAGTKAEAEYYIGEY